MKNLILVLLTYFMFSCTSNDNDEIKNDQIGGQALPTTYNNIQKNRGIHCLTSRHAPYASMIGTSMNISSSTSELLDYHNTSQRKQLDRKNYFSGQNVQ